MLSRDVEPAAEQAGIARRTLFRAKHRLHVVAERVGGYGQKGKWYWRLPAAAKGATKSATSDGVAPLEGDPANRPDFSAPPTKSATSDGVALSSEADAAREVGAV